MDSAQIDVSDPANGGAIQAALDEVGSVEAHHEPFVRRVLDECPDTLLSGQARVLMAAFEQVRGRHGEAAALYRRGLPEVWGSGTRAEANALMNYALVCVIQRRAFEGLVLLRRACEFAEERDNLDALALAKAYLARTLTELEDWERLDPLLAEMEALLPQIDATRRPYVEMVAVTTQIEAARRRGDAETARRVSDRLPALPFDDDPRSLPFQRALVFATEGRAAEAMEQVAIARSYGEGPQTYAAVLLEIEIHCGAVDVPLEQLRPQMTELLDLLELEQRERHSAGDRMIIAGRLARLLSDSGGADDLARRALRVAAGGVIERIAELERFLRALPQLCFAGPRERAILDDHRARFLARHEKLLDVVYGMLEATPDDASQFESADGNDPLCICICAWCRLLRGPDGLWLPVRKLDVPTGALRVSHGICESCRDAALGRIPLSR